MNLYLRKIYRDRIDRHPTRGRMGLGNRYCHSDARALATQWEGRDRRDCMKQFKAAWERFPADEANLTEFLKAKRKRR